MRATPGLYQVVYWLLLVSLLSASMACGGSDDTPTPSASGNQPPTEVQQAIDDLEGKVGFRPLAPAYLPDGLDPTPETAHVRDETQQTAILAFFPVGDEPATPASLAVLEITEDPATSFECPLCAGGGFTELELSGHAALSEEGQLDEEGVYYVLYFVAGDLLVTLNAEWDVAEGSELAGPTADMKQELVRVAESMLAQV